MKKKHHKKHKIIKKSKKKQNLLWNRISVNLKHTELMLFTKYLNVLLGSGLTLDEALDILVDQSSGSLKKILKSLQGNIRKGGTLSAGLENYPHIFSSVFINLIKAGESSGTLQNNLENLTLQMEKEYELRKKVKGALVYPVVVLSVAVIVMVGIIIFVMPGLVELFYSLKIELPATTKGLLWVSELFRDDYLTVIAFSITLFIFLSVLKKLKFVKPILHWILLRLPVAGKLSRDTNLARLTRLMGTMLKSGMTLKEVLSISSQVLQNVRYKKVMKRVGKEVARGGTISGVLEKHKKMFPILATRLIKVGEETGTLDKMLVYVAEFYEQEIDGTTKNLSTLLEPFVILLIGGVVALLASSIITPIYKIIGSVG
ncbi:MAG: type II secretion system F family protein [Candidatus Magasanikbacteria bacterium]|nr:type II secretion system F family protein [Candidatus Magasanikbacteria bacterium]